MNSRPFNAITGAYQTAAVARKISAPTASRRGLKTIFQLRVKIRYGVTINNGRTTPTSPFASVANPIAKQKTYQSRSLFNRDSLLSHKKKLKRVISIATASGRSNVAPRANPGHNPQVASAAALKYPNRAECAWRPKK